ncbi:hypothetical protein DUZ99_01545 [Xylanibacillus composti]|uniref:Uncharacterized protein n=1 Tax=Xylanibacillus composti TaxID=1572762 RepID=A0A8J4H6Y0_9BACL|nr:hypothetical protein [Xylanibacillus composti]MDT9723682.1 hypothetical protein [Xylanibacillus composti]GIQ71021.1 hypothetical protein XYCOK13_38450 [Xylanibacillus composti]
MNPIIAFCGTTPNIGTTLVSFAAAWQAAERSDLNIAYLCLNLKSSKLHRYLKRDHAEQTLDHLTPSLKARTLSSEGLRAFGCRMSQLPKLWFLFGNREREQAEFYAPEDIQLLLELAASYFDLTFVEVNAYWDNAATVCALKQAHHRYMVTTPNLTHFQEDLGRWQGKLASWLELTDDQFQLIVTQCPQKGEAYSISKIEKETGLAVAGHVPWLPDVDERLNAGELAGMASGCRPLRKAVEPLALQILRRNGYEPEAPAQAGWLRRLLPSS